MQRKKAAKWPPFYLKEAIMGHLEVEGEKKKKSG